jgi:hypothetical protein|tara:strand:+ start:192 stop:377 length:186 start_codon:yes stop_codon:yes gene_type:complete
MVGRRIQGDDLARFNLAAARPSGQLLEHPVKTGNVVAERSTADQIVEVHGRAPKWMATVEA